MSKKKSIFYSALMLTAVNLLLRTAGTTFQVYLSGRIGASGIGLLQLVLSVASLSMTAGIAGIRTGAMYLTAEELGKKRPGNVTWVLSGSFLYSFICSTVVASAVFIFAPAIAESWIGDIQATDALRIFAAFMPISCLCGVMTGYFTAANRITTLAAVEVAEQVCTITVTMMALQLSGLLSGAVITETVFSINGIGRLAVQAISARDIPLLQGTVLFSTALVILGNLIADSLYKVLDPRTRREA